MYSTLKEYFEKVDIPDIKGVELTISNGASDLNSGLYN